MVERAHIYEGDHTTAQGIVADGIDGTGYNGRRMAYIGAPVRCPSCGTTGAIGRVGERFAQDWYGKVPALEGDVCLCACNPNPRLLASQSQWSG
ncbi:putative Zn-binding protein involved in type VI secretion [Paraburkholderia bannensis]|uniref:Putative Zn-binding protein involved in type VI secretion n=1 Tax=Paraburkholderia bannensis TaxID=765414 RepID=A0A7W9TWB7_9BURK|nr:MULTISPECIES: PAAR domain-containing protein [Paraburkholderia]MBB3257603.1 putative Zn-binding protein involved in type VI secretion [Paraburkholderia sp. WP4_3_2]MBB6102616.1 putative Zn-binding protein involved in type VI secretion [Paraburkholderia bannensis]